VTMADLASGPKATSTAVASDPSETSLNDSPVGSSVSKTSEQQVGRASPSRETPALDTSLIARIANNDPAIRGQALQTALGLILKDSLLQLERPGGLRVSLAPHLMGLPQGLPGAIPIGQNPIASLSRNTGLDSHPAAVSNNQSKSFANADIGNQAGRPAGSGQESQVSFFMNRSTPTPQSADTSRLNQKEANITPQHTAVPEAKTEKSNEQKRNDPRAELIATDVSHKNITQTLEAALDKMFRGTAIPPETKVAGPAPQATQSPGEVIANPGLSQSVDKGSGQSSPQLSTQPNHSQTSEFIQTTISSLQQARPQDNIPVAQQDTAQNQAARQNAEQTTDQMHHQRAEQLRLIQQIIAAQTDLSPPLKTPTIIPDVPITTHPRYESTTVAVEKLRESILDKFISIQTHVETAAAERQRTTPATQTKDSLIQGRSTLDKATPIHHDAKPSQELRHGDRTNDPQRLPRAAVPGMTLPLTGLGHPLGTTIAQPDRTAFSLNSLGNILKTLQIFSRRSTNSQLIKRMDSTLERTCLTLATGVAVGALGAEVLVKTVGLGLRELLRVVREGMHEERDPTEEALEMVLENALDDYLVEGALVPSKRSMVADVSGVLICGETHRPLADVLVGSHELGSCMTDVEGRFLFSNVRIGTSYALKLYKPFFALTPDHVSGTCSFDSHHRLEIMLTPLHSQE
jgi:hypothetical protein